MTEDEILKIKEHIEIHARRKLHAVEITEILWKAVDELEYIAKLKDDLCRVTDARDGFRTVMLSYEHKIKDLENKVAELKEKLGDVQLYNAALKRKIETLLDILQNKDNTIKELRRSVAQITEPVVDKVLEQEARDWIRHSHELVDRSDFYDEDEYDHARVNDLVEVYVTAVKAHMKKE